MRNSGSALLAVDSPDAQLAGAEQAIGRTPPGDSLKHQVAERLAAHRSRRSRANPAEPAAGQPTGPQQPAESRSARIAATVAQRYAKSPSYRAVLAAEAERAIQQAQAAADVAAINAKAVATAQQLILDELNVFEDIQDYVPQAGIAQIGGEPRAEQPAPHIRQRPDPQEAQAPRFRDEPVSAEVRVLDEEIAFRQAPVFEEPAGPPVALPANLIEFPRQLVAARKARPRHAEGPLREDAQAVNDQLNIFEVDSAQISPILAAEDAAPEWTSIWLDAVDHSATGSIQLDEVAPAVQAEAAIAIDADAASAVPAVAPLSEILNQTPRSRPAPIGHRIMAATVDFCVVGAAFLACATGFALTAGGAAVDRLASGEMAASAQVMLVGAAAAAFILFHLAYKCLFFTLSDATPGMDYARIDLRTFTGGTPPRVAMQRRIAAAVLSALPLGLGFVWAAFDSDALTWHDRISKTYPRSY